MLAVEQQTWLGIAGALVPSLIALLAAVVSLLNRKQLQTSNGKTIGAMVEEVHGEASNQATSYDTHTVPPA